MKTTEWTGAASTVEDAIAKGLKKLGLSRDQVEIKVLGEKTSGLFSLFGFRRMEVKLIEKPGARRPEREERFGREGRREEFRNDRGESRDRDRNGRGPRRDEGRRQDTRGDDRPNDTPRRDGRPSESRRDDRNRPPQRDASAGRDGGRRAAGNSQRNDRPPRRDDRRPGGDRNERGPRNDGERPRDNEAPRRDMPLEGRPRDNTPREDFPRRDTPQRAPQEPPSPDALLSQWKNLLGWDDLAWTPKNGESGDIALVLDAASGEKLLAAGGQVLESLQHLLNAVRSKSDRSAPRVFLEAEGKAVMNEQRIIEEARNAAAEVQRTGSPFRLAPMDSRDRRLVHQALANHPDVETASEGDGQWRKVVVKPKNRD